MALRTIEEVEVPAGSPAATPAQPTAADVVHRLVPPPRPAAQARAPGNLALVYHAIAIAIGARLMSLLLVAAMIWLSAVAVYDPEPLRLYAGAGFDLIALVGLWLIGSRA